MLSDEMRLSRFLPPLLLAAGLAGCAPALLHFRQAVPQPVDREFVTARDGRLYLGGERYRFVGVNVYSLASFPPGSGKYYCGRAHSDQDVADIMREVAAMGGNVIRLSAYQAFTEGGTDFSRLDFVIREAGRHGLRLILTLENQWPDCTAGGYKRPGWYRSGYRAPYGGYPLSFVDHVRSIVSRYRDEPAILMWQVMNEAESVTGWGVDAPAELLAFAGNMTALIKSLDRRHPVCLGTNSIDRPGTDRDDFAALADVITVDVIDAHDYDDEDEPLPGDIREEQAIAGLAGKPFFIGEVGIPSPPFSRERRAELTRRKLEAAWRADVDGILIWSYRAGDGTNRDFDSRDPLAETVRRFTSSHLAR